MTAPLLAPSSAREMVGGRAVCDTVGVATGAACGIGPPRPSLSSTLLHVC